jgi:hypothetical protein
MKINDKIYLCLGGSLGMRFVKVFLLLLIFCASASVQAQKIIRSSMGSFGNSTTEGGNAFRQTVGQPSSTNVLSEDNIVLRQGFQQPLSGKAKMKAIKECTLYIGPNPATDMVNISVKESMDSREITVYNMMGELIFKTSTNSAEYQLNVSNYSNGTIC